MNKVSISALQQEFDNFKTHNCLEEGISCTLIDQCSAKLAKEEELRRNLPYIFPNVWDVLIETWKIVQPDPVKLLFPHGLTLSLSRFTRNLVAGVPDNQNRAFVNEPEIRQILHHLTSFSQLEDRNLHPLTRMLVQTLSNLVTLNHDLASQLWNLYITLPEDHNPFLRLLASPDMGTVNATLVLILNIMHADKSALSYFTSSNGLRMIIRLLNRTEEWADQELESSEEDEAFTIAYRLFEKLLDQNLAAPIYRALSMEDEPITPHQTTFLKFIDSYIRHSINDRSINSHVHDYSFLSDAFSGLCLYSRRALQRSLNLEYSSASAAMDHKTFAEHSNEKGLKELDMRLPKAAAGLVLVSQCITAILLQSRDAHDATGKESGYSAVLAATQATGFVEDLVETLQLLDRFLPRIVFGQPVTAPGVATPARSSADTKGFAYLKRDLVRLLGTICHERTEIQNRIRKCGGIEVVMNLCVIDERNPYMQEHALLALRNILYQNPENQAIVEGMSLLPGPT